MARSRFRSLRLSDKDLDFLVETVSPGVIDKPKLKQILREDEKFRHTFIDEEKVFRRLMDEEEIFLRISPVLSFEILLRRVARDLKEVGYTIEKSGTTKVPVFDTKNVAELLSKEYLLDYLADMLASFTRIETYAFSIQGWANEVAGSPRRLGQKLRRWIRRRAYHHRLRRNQRTISRARRSTAADLRLGKH